MSWATALRAIAPRLQAKYMPPLPDRRNEPCGPGGDGRAKAERWRPASRIDFPRQESCLKSVVQAERVQLFRQASFLREKNRFSRRLSEALHAYPLRPPRNDARCKKQRRSQFHVKNMHGTGFSVGWIPLTQRYSSKRSRSRMWSFLPSTLSRPSFCIAESSLDSDGRVTAR